MLIFRLQNLLTFDGRFDAFRLISGREIIYWFWFYCQVRVEGTIGDVAGFTNSPGRSGGQIVGNHLCGVAEISAKERTESSMPLNRIRTGLNSNLSVCGRDRRGACGGNGKNVFSVRVVQRTTTSFIIFIRQGSSIIRTPDNPDGV